MTAMIHLQCFFGSPDTPCLKAPRNGQFISCKPAPAGQGSNFRVENGRSTDRRPLLPRAGNGIRRPGNTGKPRTAAMITLYTFGPAWGLPDPSPFVTKAIVLLKMSGLPFETDTSGFRKAPRGKLPLSVTAARSSPIRP